jgi:outer membrane lipase/esterase
VISRTAYLFALLFSFFVPPTFADHTTVKFKHMFVLGDSLSDQGNLFFATSNLGPAFNLLPIPAADHYYRGRFSNGENYAGLLAQKLGFTLTPSELGGSNYAFGGSRTDYNRVEYRPGVPPPPPSSGSSSSDGVYPIGAYPWSLDLQREAFLGDVKRHADPKGLYVVFAGSNDLADALTAFVFLHQDPTPTIAKAVQGIKNVITAFETAGARTVLVPNMPNLGVVPSVTRFGPVVAGLATALSQQFNAALGAMLTAITDTNIIVFDTYSFLNSIVAHPGNYGLTNVTEPCYSGFVDPNPNGTVCAEPDKYAFWDIEHPTTRFHAILADELHASVLHCEAEQKDDTNSASGHFTSCAVNVH